MIDYYYKCDVISVADPEVFDADRVAALFVKHVFGSQITPEEPKIFMRAMRRFATREGSDEIIRNAVSKFSEIKSIRLESIVFTIAEDEDKAQARREAKAKQNEARVADGLPMLPRLKCKVFQNDNIWDQIERSFSQLVRHKALIDVWELDFDIKMYLPSKEPLLSEAYREHCCKTLSYKLKVSPKRYSYSPKWVKIDKICFTFFRVAHFNVALRSGRHYDRQLFCRFFCFGCNGNRCASHFYGYGFSAGISIG